MNVEYYDICTDNLQLVAMTSADTFMFMLDGILQVVTFEYIWCCFV